MKISTERNCLKINKSQFREKKLSSLAAVVGAIPLIPEPSHHTAVFLSLGLKFNLLAFLLCTQRKVGLLRRLRNPSLLHRHRRGIAGAGPVPHCPHMALGHTGNIPTWSGEPLLLQVKHTLLRIANPLWASHNGAVVVIQSHDQLDLQYLYSYFSIRWQCYPDRLISNPES